MTQAVMSRREPPDQLWDRIWPVVLTLIVAAVAWFLLSLLSFHARQNGARWPNATDYNTAKTWATDILGLAISLAGFLGIAEAARRAGLEPTQRAMRAEGGMIGILAGATLLEVGGWPVPLGLVAVATGAAAGRVILALQPSKKLDDPAG